MWEKPIICEFKLDDFLLAGSSWQVACDRYVKLRKTTSSESSMAILSNLYNATENLEIERKNFLECVGKIQNFDLNVYVMDYVKSYNNLDLMYLRLMDLY